MWIDRLPREVQGRGLWAPGESINRGRPGDAAPATFWENPARIGPPVPIHDPLNFLNELLSFNNSERIAARPALPVNEPLRPDAVWTSCGRGCGFTIHAPRETSDS